MRVSQVIVLTLAGVSLIAQEPPMPAKKGINLYSLEKEAALGKQLATDFRKRTTPIDVPSVQNYVDRLGQRIAAQIPDAQFRFTFSVIADDPCRTIHEPAALPGGYVFVPAALLVATQDEAEFAGMLAHAMEHIAQRHGTRQATEGVIKKDASIPLFFMGGWGGGCSDRQAIPLKFMALQRSAELEADSFAVQTLARAGFDPTALVRYIQRVQIRPGGPVSTVPSPLPDLDQRLAKMSSAIETLPPVNRAVGTSGEFAAAQQEVRRLAEPPSGRSTTPPSLMRKTPQ
jgi:predicted Zn-dependent protease